MSQQVTRAGGQCVHPVLWQQDSSVCAAPVLGHGPTFLLVYFFVYKTLGRIHNGP